MPTGKTHLDDDEEVFGELLVLFGQGIPEAFRASGAFNIRLSFLRPVPLGLRYACPK